MNSSNMNKYVLKMRALDIAISKSYDDLIKAILEIWMEWDKKDNYKFISGFLSSGIESFSDSSYDL